MASGCFFVLPVPKWRVKTAMSMDPSSLMTVGIPVVVPMVWKRVCRCAREYGVTVQQKDTVTVPQCSLSNLTKEAKVASEEPSSCP